MKNIGLKILKNKSNGYLNFNAVETAEKSYKNQRIVDL
jgi:hypothetical protein